MSRLCHALTLEEMCTCSTQHQYYRPACEWIDGTVVDLQPGVITFNFQKKQQTCQHTQTHIYQLFKAREEEYGNTYSIPT